MTVEFTIRNRDGGTFTMNGTKDYWKSTDEALVEFKKTFASSIRTLDWYVVGASEIAPVDDASNQSRRG